MTKKIDEMRVANAFAHVYREDYKTVLNRVSVSLMDPTGFSPVEYLRIKEAIKNAKKH